MTDILTVCMISCATSKVAKKLSPVLAWDGSFGSSVSARANAARLSKSLMASLTTLVQNRCITYRSVSVGKSPATEA